LFGLNQTDAKGVEVGGEAGMKPGEVVDMLDLGFVEIQGYSCLWSKGLDKPRVPVKLLKSSRYMGGGKKEVWKSDNREKERGSVSGSCVCVCFVVSGEESGDVENFQGRAMDPREVSTRFFCWVFSGSFLGL
jgi:hypothetical protein